MTMGSPETRAGSLQDFLLHQARGVFRDDFVRHKKKGYIGSVLETVESLLDPDDEHENRPSVPPGYVVVAWRGGSKVEQQGILCRIEHLEVIDRPFDLSGFVKRLAQDDEQAGVVVDVTLTFDIVELSHVKAGPVIHNVPAERLRRLNQYDGALVVDTENGRLAKVDWWMCDVELELDESGALCTLSMTSADEPLTDVTRGYTPKSMFVCVDPFPGQRITIAGARLMPAKWRSSGYPSNYLFRNKAYTATVRAVAWKCLDLTYMTVDDPKDAGTRSLEQHALEYVRIASPPLESLIVDPWGQLVMIRENETRGRDAAPLIGEVPYLMLAAQDKAYEWVNRKSFTTVQWKDGTVERGIPATSLRPYLFFNSDEELFPGDYVSVGGGLRKDKLGVILRVGDGTCLVRWLENKMVEIPYCEDTNLFLGLPSDADAMPGVEETSVYEVRLDADISFVIGSVVMRLDVNDDMVTGDVGSTRLRRAGRVRSIHHTGHVGVVWLDGSLSCVSPWAVVRVANDEGSAGSDIEVDPEDDDWETDGEDVAEEGLQEGATDGDGDDRLLPNQAAESDSQPIQSGLASKRHQGTAELPAARRLVPLPVDEFEPFSILDKAPGLPHRQYPAHPITFGAKVLRKEYRLLAESLPPGIYVRAYEDRMDVFSLLILGPEDTPYEGNAFVFDILLSADYPRSPPAVHYHNRCEGRLNPNLYEDGKVCLSLIGTWPGHEEESWTPRSTLLQVAVSIQALVLNKEPYYNEAGFERQRGHSEASRSARAYNELTVIKSLEHLAAMAADPMPAFIKEINRHTNLNAATIIKRHSELLEDQLTNEQIESWHTFPLLPVSQGFRLSLKKRLERLQQVLVGRQALSQ